MLFIWNFLRTFSRQTYYLDVRKRPIRQNQRFCWNYAAVQFYSRSSGVV